MPAKSKEDVLISPDDQSRLIRKGDVLVDQSGNQYGCVDGVYDLRPKKPICGEMPYRIFDQEKFRSYPYAQGLKPLFKSNTSQKLSIKEKNISTMIPPSGDGAKCLDHGCGAGAMRTYVESRGYDYYGVDNESGVTTKQGGGKHFLGGATHLCNLHRLPFKDNTFKFAISYSVFEHLQNPFVGAQELYRVMEPGGVCFIAVGSLVPFHMDSFYHHTHFGVLNTFISAGFEVEQIAGASWNAYHAISGMDGLPGPKWLRWTLSHTIYAAHRLLWKIRTMIKKRNPSEDELLRCLIMAGIIKTVLRKPQTKKDA